MIKEKEKKERFIQKTKTQIIKEYLRTVFYSFSIALIFTILLSFHARSEMIKNLKLKEGNLITATLTSAVSSIGQTEEWLLLKIDDISRVIYNLEDIFPS